MAKMRGFKPDLWSDDDFIEASPLARLLWLGMWNHACDNGHLADKPRQIKRKVLPADDASGESLVAELAELGLIVREGGWITIPNLSKHQKLDWRWYLTCDHPGCVEPPRPKRETRRGHGGATAGPREHTTGPRDEGEGEGEGEGIGGDKSPAPRKRAAQLPDTWQPNRKHQDLAAERGVNLGEEAAKFRDWAASKGEAKKDWDAAFRNWVRNARPTLPASAPGGVVAPVRRVVARQCDERAPHRRHTWESGPNLHGCEGVA